ncbi:cytidylyltransferase family protein [alpha proteobacterium HIMB5]|nr:cytidylyltransferase family protein [alpha proteobacterium HIMB5]
MIKELNLRIFTSVALIVLLALMFKYSVVLISVLLLIFVVSWLEFNNILENIYKKNTNIFFKNLSKFFIFIYLLFFMKVIVDEFLQNQPNISWNLIFVISICILSDIGGFIFGKFFKGKKLTKISPNKTYSGMIGSFILSIIFCVIYSYTISFVDFKTIFLLTILISFICQIGDLFISFLKRKAKIKDTGDLLPGHGGVLDRIDGILFALPSGIILINYFY